jgi:lambda family phage minor tail protein L
MPVALEVLVKESELPSFIELFEIDLSPIGFENLYLTPSTRSLTGIIFGTSERIVNGKPAVTIPERTFLPYPIAISGLEANSDGSFSRPRLDVANVDTFFGKLSFAYGDLVGCKVTYIRTFEDYIASGFSAPEVILTIGKKISHNVKGISYELRYPLDIERGFLPKNQILRDPHLNRSGEVEEIPGASLNNHIG